MPSATWAGSADIAARATRLIAAIEDVLHGDEALVAELEERDIEFSWLDKAIRRELESALTGPRALEAVGGDPDAYTYWRLRVYMRATLDEQRGESGWERFAAFHQRFEAAFPELAIELSRAAHLASFSMQEPDPELESRALTAIAQLAGAAS